MSESNSESVFASHQEKWHGFDVYYTEDLKGTCLRYSCRVRHEGDHAFDVVGSVDVVDLASSQPEMPQRIQEFALARARAIIDLQSFQWGQTLQRSLHEPRGADNAEISQHEVRRKLLEVFNAIQHELPQSYTSQRVDVDGLCLELDISTDQYHSAVNYLLGKGWLQRWEHYQDSQNYRRLHITATGIDELETDRRQELVGEPTSKQPDFSFITDPDLRSIIERDYAEIPTCLEAGAWKAATVMSGSVMEALLLDALLTAEAKAKQSHKAPKDKRGKVIEDLARWTLNTMIEVAIDLQLLRRDPLGLTSHGVREYRNLIHPGAEIREAIVAEREEAMATRAALDLIIKQLT